MRIYSSNRVEVGRPHCLQRHSMNLPLRSPTDRRTRRCPTCHLRLCRHHLASVVIRRHPPPPPLDPLLTHHARSFRRLRTSLPNSHHAPRTAYIPHSVPDRMPARPHGSLRVYVQVSSSTRLSVSQPRKPAPRRHKREASTGARVRYPHLYHHDWARSLLCLLLPALPHSRQAQPQHLGLRRSRTRESRLRSGLLGRYPRRISSSRRRLPTARPPTFSPLPRLCITSLTTRAWRCRRQLRQQRSPLRHLRRPRRIQDTQDSRAPASVPCTDRKALIDSVFAKPTLIFNLC